MTHNVVLSDGTTANPAVVDKALVVDWMARDVGLDNACRIALRRAAREGCDLVRINKRLQTLKRQGLLRGVGGVYITHERNRRGDKVYHRVRLNICAGGRRVRHDLGSYRVR